MPSYPSLNPDFKDALAALCAEGAEFIIVGAYAVGAHGAPRSTGDLDIFVRPSPENAPRVWRALRQFGAPLRDLSIQDFESKDLIYQIGVPPSRVDIITGISGVTFEEAWEGHIEHEVEGQVIPVLGLQELLENKRASGRTKDLADAETLEALIEYSTGGEPGT